MKCRALFISVCLATAIMGVMLAGRRMEGAPATAAEATAGRGFIDITKESGLDAVINVRIMRRSPNGG